MENRDERRGRPMCLPLVCRSTVNDERSAWLAAGNQRSWINTGKMKSGRQSVNQFPLHLPKFLLE